MPRATKITVATEAEVELPQAPENAGGAADLMEEGGSHRQSEGGLRPSQVRRVSDHVSANLDRVIRISELARIANLSQSQFCRLFRKSVGLSPSTFVRERRVTHAKELLLTTNLGIPEIALRVGMSDQSHFCRVFHQAVGLPPGTWRKQAQAFSRT